ITVRSLTAGDGASLLRPRLRHHADPRTYPRTSPRQWRAPGATLAPGAGDGPLRHTSQALAQALGLEAEALARFRLAAEPAPRRRPAGPVAAPGDGRPQTVPAQLSSLIGRDLRCVSYSVSPTNTWSVASRRDSKCSHQTDRRAPSLTRRELRMPCECLRR